ncbi:putative serine protease K12H4.7 [Zeugodacus cucurbitae]|uniref:putative serine protease K12H4.7 n=1 Tax=Zeugodacus cucurbitae TaxID=28588 RepID=UPI0010A74558|nr:putative serine protease K12H4.7 [Zeugodacus cucurbitae]
MQTDLTTVTTVTTEVAASGKVEQLRINPFERNLQFRLREPPLKQADSILNKDLVQELWLEQKLDQFDETNNKTWLMRFLRNDRYFKPHGPVFIFVGGEWEISAVYLLTGHMHDIARQHNGMLYYVEHRYYGQSWPIDDASVENLRFLSARQALADLAHFIRQLKSRETELSYSKVILTGASYSGSLVAWFAKLYPDLMDAGWASSAPLVAKLDFFEYMHQVGKVIQQRGGPECADRLDRGLNDIATLLESTEAAQLLRALRICNNFVATNQLDRAALFNGLGNYFAAFAQLYDDQIASEICTPLKTTTDEDDLTTFIEFLRRIFWPEFTKQAHGEDWCIDLSYEGMKSIFTDLTDQLSGTRPWFHQSCHEFGWFTTTANNSRHNKRPKASRQATAAQRHEGTTQLQHSFGRQVPLNYFQRLCRDTFEPSADTTAHSGIDIATIVKQTNSHFGGLTAGTVLQQRVIFTHGQLDPWRAVGLQRGKNVINIADYSHTADLDSIDFADTVEMNVAKLKVAAFLRSVLRRKTTKPSKLATHNNSKTGNTLAAL